MTSTEEKSVLVVDDDRHTLDFVTECLSSMGQKVYSAANGEEAMELLGRPGVKIDLLLSDVVMPGINGIELARRMAATAPAAKIIFMSGYMKPSLPNGNCSKYEDGFIQKPFSGKTLINHVKQAFDEMATSADS